MRHSTIEDNSLGNVSDIKGDYYTIQENDNIKAYGIDPIGKVSEQQGDGVVARSKCPVVIYSPALTITTGDVSGVVSNKLASASYGELFFEKCSSEDTINYTNTIEPTQFLRMYSMMTNILTINVFRGYFSMLIKGFSKETDKATGVTINTQSEDINNNLSVFTREKVVYQIALGDYCPLINGLHLAAYTTIIRDQNHVPSVHRINVVLRSIDTRVCNVTAPVGTYSTININGTSADIYRVLYATAKPTN